MPYPWYERVAGRELQQGDILRNCLAPVLPRLQADPVVVAVAPVPEPVDQYDRVIVLTQSCDLRDDSVPRVMLCPVHELDEFLQSAGSRAKQNERKGYLKSGRLVAHQLLNLCDVAGVAAPHLVADFGDAFSHTLGYVRRLAEDGGERARLLPPYREHLAQAFARYYMRVGLPVDVAPMP
jgi:hypothetical protein